MLHEIVQLKARLKGLKILLKENFKISVNKYFKKTLRDISHSHSKNLFPTINKLFRNTRHNNTTNTLQIPLSEKANLENQIHITEFEEDQNQNLMLIHGENDTVNTLGYYFEKVHKSNDTLGTLENDSQVCNTINDHRFMTEATPSLFLTYTKEHFSRPHILHHSLT